MNAEGNRKDEKKLRTEMSDLRTQLRAQAPQHAQEMIAQRELMQRLMEATAALSSAVAAQNGPLSETAKGIGEVVKSLSEANSRVGPQARRPARLAVRRPAEN